MTQDEAQRSTADTGNTEPTKEWWAGHRTGFVKGIKEARLMAIERAKEESTPKSPVSVALRLLAHKLHEEAGRYE